MKQKNLINSLKLAGLLAVSGLAGCEYNYCCPDCCPDCNKQKTEVVKETPAEPAPQPKPKPKPKPQPAPQPEPAPAPAPTPAPEPEPEKKCVQKITTTHTYVTLSGDPDDVISAMLEILNAQSR